jgi:uncharacterized protein YjbI with pentapeptide repeats
MRNIKLSVLRRLKKQFGDEFKKRLQDADLRGADLGGADLRNADLGDADLGGADLRNADLGDANLIGAYLRGAYLGGADLRGADLQGADLGGAYLRNAYLRGADLGGADLGNAYLVGADLGGADLGGADLGDANMQRAKGIRYAQLSFAGFGGGDRMITAVALESGTVYFCGCFAGGRDMLEKYIASGKESYKSSRMFAVETLDKMLEFSA